MNAVPNLATGDRAEQDLPHLTRAQRWPRLRARDALRRCRGQGGWRM